MRPIRRVVVHHSGSPKTTTLEVIDGWHAAKGWGITVDGMRISCGYHYVIEGDATIRVGRPESAIGAHAAGWNRDSIGVCVVGNNEIAGSGWDVPQVEGLLALLQDLVRRYGLEASAVVGHSEVMGDRLRADGRAYSCPGGPVNMEAVRSHIQRVKEEEAIGWTDGAPEAEPPEPEPVEPSPPVSEELAGYVPRWVRLARWAGF